MCEMLIFLEKLDNSIKLNINKLFILFNKTHLLLFGSVINKAYDFRNIYFSFPLKFCKI
jgi:hypothetical protein